MPHQGRPSPDPGTFFKNAPLHKQGKGEQAQDGGLDVLDGALLLCGGLSFIGASLLTLPLSMQGGMMELSSFVDV